MTTRREFAKAGGLFLAGLVGRPVTNAFAVPVYPNRTVDIIMYSNTVGSDVWFDPIGVHIESGQSVRWTVEQHAHTATAYHPVNGGHQQRIPADATPWDSGYLLNPGDTFEVTFEVEGVYDYFCLPHEAAGMVGRIVVGNPAPSSVVAFSESVPAAARNAFPPVDEILRQGVVRPAGARRARNQV